MPDAEGDALSRVRVWVENEVSDWLNGTEAWLRSLYDWLDE